ncbi:MAG: hypothetical protein HYW14_00580 [Planctomycetes bacterium]|nr:hypothetical protein [Planctomycetota bacterium]
MLKTLKEIKEEGWHALVEKLGVAGATMFLMEHEKGYGDYTIERRKIFDEKSIDEIVKEIKKIKSSK